MKLSPLSTPALITRVVLLGLFNVSALWLAITLGSRMSVFLGILIGIFALVTNIVFIDDRLFPWRWIVPAFAGMVLLVLYPIGYSLSVAFTNYGDNHTYDKGRAIQIITGQGYIEPAEPRTFQTYIYTRQLEKPALTDFRFYLIDQDGNAFVGKVDEEKLTPAAEVELGEKDANGVPATISGEFKKVPPQTFSQTLQGLTLNDPPYQVQLTTLQLLQQRFLAKRLEQRYIYDEAADTITDRQTGEVYTPERGTFINRVGETKKELSPGFYIFLGLDNLTSVVTDPQIRGPFFMIFIWTISFALGSVVSTFALGLLFALLLNAKQLPFRVIFRSLLILPYAIPFWLSARTWQGLLGNNAPVNNIVVGLMGRPQGSVNLFADPTAAKLVVLFVNLYLGFPYMMLICLGALQSIPSDMYEAAVIDGADDRQQFQFITLPLLLLAVGPLLIASFAFNFNNFTLIELLNGGGPPMSAGGVAGHTDILLSYTFRLAFGGSRGAQYGFAAAIGIFIFVIVASITFINFRFTRQLEEVSKNV
ncbi:MAG TPA: ABC transporter permease subunit [Aggregatilineales bacterium]|nr:ABC transporter permease subunit [Anaerolineales bacterium]HRE48336.1 ABC transporter permease subunit [Aggregatilineales bacterium]